VGKGRLTLPLPLLYHIFGGCQDENKSQSKRHRNRLFAHYGCDFYLAGSSVKIIGGKWLFSGRGGH
jgi:hypothetical protein